MNGQAPQDQRYPCPRTKTLSRNAEEKWRRKGRRKKNESGAARKRNKSTFPNRRKDRHRKTVDLEKANGESVGIIKFSGHGPKIYKSVLNEMVRDPENMKVFYLKAIHEIIHKGYPVHYSLCQESDWGEIDFHPDLMLIRKYVSRNNLVDKIFHGTNKL